MNFEGRAFVAGFFLSVIIAGCGGGSGGGNVGLINPTPVVIVSANTQTVLEGDTVAITWSSTNATSCSASGSWSGQLSSSGTQSPAAVSAGSNTYTVSCTNGSATANSSVIVFANPSETFTGKIYSRIESASFNSNDVSPTLLSGVTISSGVRTFQSDSNGNFSGIISNKVLATDTLNFSKNGYIPISIARSLIDNGNPPSNIGIYSAPNVNSRPGFIGGVFTMDAGGDFNTIYNSGLFPSTYNRTKTKIGANLVAVSDPVWVESYDAASATVRMSSTSSIPMLTRQQYTTLVSLAHGNNMKFMMQLGLYPAGNLQLPWSVPPNNNAFWTAWFNSYKAIAVQYAQIAKDLNIEYISLGMNHGFMSSLPFSYWSDLIVAIRNTGYSGQIVYQAGTNPGYDSETDGFNMASSDPSLTAQQKQLQFVGLFDSIILNVYNIAAKSGSANNISRSEMRTAFTAVLNKLTHYPVPLMVQIGTPSVIGGAVNTDYIEPCVVCNSIAPMKTMDLMQQADVYQAIAEVINSTPTGNGNVMGLLSWGYWFTDNFRANVTAESTGINADGTLVDFKGYIGNLNLIAAYDKSANIRGKPAESILGWWVGKFTQ